MMWIDKSNPDTVYIDRRCEVIKMKDSTDRTGFQTMVVRPDVLCEFTNLPFRSCQFNLVAFDPPHLLPNGAPGWLTKRYGRLSAGWKDELAAAFREGFRVLRVGGTLVFKWCELDITVSEIAKLSPIAPLFGHRSGKQSKTHWLVFTKTEDGALDTAEGRGIACNSGRDAIPLTLWNDNK